MALNTSVPLFKQVKESIPELVALNAMYSHGMGVIISTKCRYGGYGKGVAIRPAVHTSACPYSKIIIRGG